MFFRKSCNEKLEDNHHSFIISQSVNHPYGLVTNRNGAKGHQLQLAHGLVEALQRVSYAGVGGWGVCVLQTSTTVKSNQPFCNRLRNENILPTCYIRTRH
jgi:hypothetical protein